MCVPYVYLQALELLQSVEDPELHVFGLLVWTFAWAMKLIMAIWNLCFTGMGFIISLNSLEHIRSRVDSLLLQTTFLDVNLSGCGHGSSMRSRLLNLRQTIKTHQTVPWNRR